MTGASVNSPIFSAAIAEFEVCLYWELHLHVRSRSYSHSHSHSPLHSYSLVHKKKLEHRIRTVYGDRFIFRDLKRSRHFLITSVADPYIILYILACGVDSHNRQISIFLCRRQGKREISIRLDTHERSMIIEFVDSVKHWLWTSLGS